jgi:AcrR family transcriptional regulator
MVAAATDGRVARGRRTQSAIVVATLALIEAGDPAPTSRRIAARAGVSERALFLHFPDLETLHAAVAEGHLATVTASLSPIDPSLPFAVRLCRFSEQRSVVLERITPLRRVALRYGEGSQALKASRRRWSRLAGEEVAAVFGSEIRGAASPAVTLAAAQMVTGWGAWDELRIVQGLSVCEAIAAQELALERVLAPGPKPVPG